MAWKLNGLIYLYLTNVRLSDLENTNNSLGLCDSLLDKNEQELLIAFSPLKQEVFDAFTKIVQKIVLLILFRFYGVIFQQMIYWG